MAITADPGIHFALSIRQPWAWLIVNGGKDVENRDWSTSFRGPIYIHASKGMTGEEYDYAHFFAHKLGISIPHQSQLERGGIIGKARIVDCVRESTSPWFFGAYGFVLDHAEPLPFRPFKGQLGFFRVP